MADRTLAATVSGSFRRAMQEVQDAVYALADASVQVLSPADPRVVDAFGDFLFVASDRIRTIRPVQSRHLAAIERSDFVWLVAPEGYVGQSAAMEIGFAVAVGTRVFTTDAPTDLTLRQYVDVVPDMRTALEQVRSPRTAQGDLDLLLDPATAAEHAHRQLDVVARELQTRSASDALIRATAEDLRSVLRRV